MTWKHSFFDELEKIAIVRSALKRGVGLIKEVAGKQLSGVRAKDISERGVVELLWKVRGFLPKDTPLRQMSKADILKSLKDI